jgi:hypothetical protein
MAGVMKATKRPKLTMRFCQLCHKSSHVTNKCWELEKNEDKRQEEWKLILNNLQDAWDTLSSSGEAPVQEAEVGTAD